MRSLSELDPSNEELLRRYALADREAFDLFYRRNQKLLFRFLYLLTGNQADTDEAFQETFLRLHRYIRRYNPQQKALSWVLVIARNAAIDLLRRRRSSGADPDTLASPTNDENQMIARDTLQRLLADLVPEERDLIVARYVADIEHAELARLDGGTTEATRQRLSRLMRRLRATGAALRGSGR